MLNPIQLHELGTQFGRLFYERQLESSALPTLATATVDEAYLAQDAAIAFRVARGETVTGYKVGCTSKSIQQQLGLTEPYCGKVMSPHVIAESNAPVHRNDFVALAIEPELVIRFGRDLDPDRLTDAEIIAAIEMISPGIELHHFKFWQGRPSSQELIVSNGLFAGLVIGQAHVSPQSLDFRNEVFRVFENATLVTEGVARDIMGGPLESLRWLARKLAARGERICAGHVVIPGSPVALVRIDHDAEIIIEITSVGHAQATFR